MSDEKMEAATGQAMIDRLMHQRLPRLLDMQKRVDAGERMSDEDIDYLKSVLEEANRNKGYFVQHPESHKLAGQVVDLYDQIMKKALENEQKGT
ncbi:hypothetical protein LVB87_11065 [Lysobacter sp. KIS68-7]|uniref:hypothetical protein n=1 Tax=Lysobacter sp. KIS68-7 TaxID=2904252 RepID=UPI001E4A004D|nr:hypothetical protein [Lysobacter sp. KIS68-7]UHQ18726.1 hypothetical protein LVB87_11065 [Lysobacter sp. KIS68-7]